ncbi:DUF4381 domain-containing protein [uncultured Pseudoteredinibacter sp.]|uniref:DUF4381 domain-containing protein n=1 Tax=uncultured Pseudoteredinibacter sp. TaxID=1641701 RepID=UPI002637260C|nr:DUF4381 domain-containing protein [uncultured Pseudoteredinibacter sp.]
MDKNLFSVFARVPYVFTLLAAAIFSKLMLISPAFAQVATSGAKPGSTDPLAELRDIRLPAEPNLIPPGLLWFSLIVFIALITALIALRKYKQSANYNSKLKNQWAIKEFDAIPQENKLEFIQQANALLKRVAIVHYSTENPAGLNQQQWLIFLSRHCPELDPQALQLLSEAPYWPAEKLSNSNIAPLQQACRTWLLRHQGGSHA